MAHRFRDNLIHNGANEDLVRVFTQQQVRFVLIGGLAIAWYCQERDADDMDLLIEPTEENSVRITQALSQLGIVLPADTSFAKPGLQVPLKQTQYAELLTPLSDGPRFSSVDANAVEGRLFNMPVRIASVGDLIEMKRHAVRAGAAPSSKHHRDIELLEKHGA